MAKKKQLTRKQAPVPWFVLGADGNVIGEVLAGSHMVACLEALVRFPEVRDDDFVDWTVLRRDQYKRIKASQERQFAKFKTEICFREAGHAVIACRLGIELGWTEVGLKLSYSPGGFDLRRDSFGQTSISEIVTRDRWKILPAYARRFLMFRMAGPLAANRFRGLRQWDRPRWILNSPDMMGSEGLASQGALTWCDCRRSESGQELLDHDRHTSCVKVYLHGLCRRTAAEIVAVWPQIQLAAAVLEREGKLKATDIFTILMAGPGLGDEATPDRPKSAAQPEQVPQPTRRPLTPELG